LTRERGQVVGARTQVHASGERCVVHVLGIAYGVAIRIDTHGPPRGRQELHGANGTIEPLVPVELSGVGVAHPSRAVPSV
jgi:hypothetical protein